MLWRKKASPGVEARTAVVSVYSKPGCHLCEIAKEQLLTLQRRHGFQLKEVDISLDAKLLEEFGTRIPLIWVNGRLVGKYHIDEAVLLEELRRVRAAGEGT